MKVWHRNDCRWGGLLAVLLFIGIVLAFLHSGAWAADSTKVMTTFGATEDVDDIIRTKRVNGTITEVDTFANRQTIPDSVYVRAGQITQIDWAFKFVTTDSAWAHHIITHDRTNGYATTGTYTHFISLVDTSSPGDSSLANIKIVARNSAGSPIGARTTNGDGVASFTLDSGAFSYSFFSVAYSSDTLVDTVTGSGDTTVMSAYDDHTTNTTRVWGTVIGVSGDSIEYAQLLFTAPGGNNTCDSSLLKTREITVYSERAGGPNHKGYFYVDLIRSSCLDDKDYTLTFGDVTENFTVTDSTTQRIYF